MNFDEKRIIRTVQNLSEALEHTTMASAKRLFAMKRVGPAVKDVIDSVKVYEPGYNGWTNYETWCLFCWIDSDEATQKYWTQAAQWARASGGPDDLQVGKLALRLKEEIEEQVPEVTGFWADMMNAALSEVNWAEIAKNFIKTT